MRFVLAVLLFIAYLAVFAAGSFAPPLHLTTVLARTPFSMRLFIWDGVVFLFLFYGLTLGLLVPGGRLRRLGGWATGAAFLALVCGLLLRLGFVTHGG